jgi:ATP-binding cassette subfamily B protein
LETTSQFYEAEAIRYEGISLWFLLKYVKPYRAMIKQLIIGLFRGILLQSILPFLKQSIVDQGIGHRKLNFIQLILITQLVLVARRILIEVIRRTILLHISIRGKVSLISDFLTKLMKLPISLDSILKKRKLRDK